MLPLAGVRVVDLTTVVMGPFASQWLGDLGADVIKIEAPGGDSTRYTGPTHESGMAAMFLGMNRNKRSVVLDLKQPQARESLLKVIEGADIFMHNIRPQKIEALGLGPDVLHARNSRLVYAGLHGFRKAGPYGGQPAYDDTIQGLSGCADLVRRQTGQAGYFPMAVADKVSGLIAVVAILAALRSRERSGKGTVVEIPMFESMVSFNLVEHLFGQHFDPPLADAGYPRVLSRARSPFKTQDGHICMIPYTDAHWHAFFEEASVPETAADSRFCSIADRTTYIDELYGLAASLIRTKSTAQWLDICRRRHIPVAPVLSLEDLIADPHLLATDYFASIDDARMGRMRFAGVPVLFDGERPGITVPPRLGAHTEEVLREAGVNVDELDALVRAANSHAAHASNDTIE